MTPYVGTLQILSTATFQELDRALFDFLRNMPPVNYSTMASLDHQRQQFLTYTLAQAAVIRLYGNLSDIMSVQKALVAALSVSAELNKIPDLNEWRFVDPLFGVSHVVCPQR